MATACTLLAHAMGAAHHTPTGRAAPRLIRRTRAPVAIINKGVNTGVDGVNRGVNRGVHMYLSCASAAPALGLCGKPTSPPRRRTIAKMDIHIHTGACLPTVGVRLQLEVDPRREQVVQRWHVRGGRRIRRPLLRPTRLRAVRPEVGPLGELAVEAPARRCEVRNGVHAHAKAGGGQQWGAGRKY